MIKTIEYELKSEKGKKIHVPEGGEKNAQDLVHLALALKNFTNANQVVEKSLHVHAIACNREGIADCIERVRYYKQGSEESLRSQDELHLRYLRYFNKLVYGKSSMQAQQASNILSPIIKCLEEGKIYENMQIDGERN